MSIALDLRGIAKRYVAGVGSCSIRADVLRGIDLTVLAGESIAVVGTASAGKSTLLLCAAGLLRPDAGAVRWFGEASTTAAALRSTFYLARSHGGVGMRGVNSTSPHLHLVDAIDDLDQSQLDGLTGWVSRRCAAGDAVILSGRDRTRAAGIADRIVVIRAGRLELEPRVPARVAEGGK